MARFCIGIFIIAIIQPIHGFWGIRETFGMCTFTRQDAVDCMRKYVDTNHDDKLSLIEMRIAKKRFLPYSLQAAGWLAKKFHIDTSIRSAMRDCRVHPVVPRKGKTLMDKDLTFGPDDFLKTGKTCLPSQWALCQLKKVCDNAEQLSGM